MREKRHLRRLLNIYVRIMTNRLLLVNQITWWRRKFQVSLILHLSYIMRSHWHLACLSYYSAAIKPQVKWGLFLSIFVWKSIVVLNMNWVFFLNPLLLPETSLLWWVLHVVSLLWKVRLLNLVKGYSVGPVSFSSSLSSCLVISIKLKAIDIL